MDYLGLIKSEHWIEISNDFDYMRVIDEKKFVGLRLFPLFKTPNMKLAMARLMEGGEIPVMAFVHGLDTEARIGDRPNYETIKFELLLIKEKLNQGEVLRKKKLDYSMSDSEREILIEIYNDAANLISRVLTRMEVMACELLTSGKVTIDENNAKYEVDYQLPASHKIAWSGFNDPDSDIIGSLINIKRLSNNKIKRALISEKILGYFLNNNAIKKVAASQVPVQFVTQEWLTAYLKSLLNIEFIVTSGTYKKAAQDNTEYYFFKQDVITFLTTDETVGNTFVTSSPEEDYGITSRVEGYVAITQWKTYDPAGVWTKASAVALPCPRDIKSIYLATISETTKPDSGGGGDQGDNS